MGRMTASFKASFAPSSPATSFHRTFGFSITIAPRSTQPTCLQIWTLQVFYIFSNWSIFLHILLRQSQAESGIRREKDSQIGSISSPPTHELLLQFFLFWIFTLTVTVTPEINDRTDRKHENTIKLDSYLTQNESDIILVIALCLLDGFLALFVFILQVVLKFLCSVQVLHAFGSYALLCLVAVGLIWTPKIQFSPVHYSTPPQLQLGIYNTNTYIWWHEGNIPQHAGTGAAPHHNSLPCPPLLLWWQDQLLSAGDTQICQPSVKWKQMIVIYIQYCNIYCTI